MLTENHESGGIYRKLCNFQLVITLLSSLDCNKRFLVFKKRHLHGFSKKNKISILCTVGCHGNEEIVFSRKT